MKIVLAAGGSSIHTVRWANAFAQRGLDVFLVTQHAPLDSLDSRVILYEFPHHKGLGYFLNGPKLARLIAELKPDVVNAHYAGGYGTLARWVRGVPYVLNVWGSDVFNVPNRTPLHRALLRSNLRRAWIVVSTSHVMAEQARRVCPELEDIPVVPFGVDTSRFRPAVRREAAQGGYRLVIGTVKTLDSIYGIDVLLKAFRFLLDRLALSGQGTAPHEVGLRIVGDGPRRDELKHLASALGIAAQTRFVGPVSHEEVPGELANLDVYCALSRFESFGVAIIEASACGLPVIVSDAGGLPEVVVDGKTGIIVPREQPEAAAVAMEALVQDPRRRAAMGTAGVEHVVAHYEWGRCVEKLLVVFEQAMRSHHTAPRAR